MSRGTDLESLLFAQEGAKVIVTGRNPATIDEARGTLPDNVEILASDGADLHQITQLVDHVKAAHGRLDVLFVNAGIAAFAPIGAVDEDHFDRQFDLNVKGAFFLMQAAAALMGEGGSIVLTASVAASKATAAASVYSATKAALRSLGRSFAAELAPKSIRVNTISPGPIETPIFGKTGLPPEAIAEFARQAVAALPLKRFGRPEEVAQAALFLASDDSSFVTGVDLLVDGGLGDAS